MKYCPKCGAANEDNVAFCAACGEKMDAEPTKVDTVEAPDSNVNTGEASAGWFWLGLLMGLNNLLFAIAALVVGNILKGKRFPSLGKKLAKGGLIALIVDAVVLVLAIIVLVLYVIFVFVLAGVAGAM